MILLDAKFHSFPPEINVLTTINMWVWVKGASLFSIINVFNQNNIQKHTQTFFMCIESFQSDFKFKMKLKCPRIERKLPALHKVTFILNLMTLVFIRDQNIKVIYKHTKQMTLLVQMVGKL